MPKYSEYTSVITIPIKAKMKDETRANFTIIRSTFSWRKKYRITKASKQICRPRVAVPTKKFREVNDIYDGYWAGATQPVFSASLANDNSPPSRDPSANSQVG